MFLASSSDHGAVSGLLRDRPSDDVRDYHSRPTRRVEAMPRDLAWLSLQLSGQNVDGRIRRTTAPPVDTVPQHIGRDFQPDAEEGRMPILRRSLDPVAAMEKLVGFTFDYVMDNRAFVQLLTNENMMEAKHVKRSKVIKSTHTPIVDLVSQTLSRGEASGVFRPGIAPVQLYISIAALCFFYSANIHTLGILFDRDFRSKSEMAERRAHVIDFVMGSLIGGKMLGKIHSRS